MDLRQLRVQIDRRTRKEQSPQAANSFINEAINIISSYREWPWLDGQQTITTTTDETYPVSSDYSETRTVSVNGEEAQQIYVADGDQYELVDHDRESSAYRFTIEYNAGTAELRFFPQPPEGITILHRYTRSEPLISADGDTPLMPERYHSIIADKAAALFLDGIEPARAQNYEEKVTKALKEMREAVQRKTNPGRIRIRPGSAY